MTNKEAIEVLKEEWRINAELFGKQFDEALEFAIKALEERPKGEWIIDKENSFTIDMFKCSICGYFGHTHFNFCPNCGANMGKR